jgi:cytochrome c553
MMTSTTRGQFVAIVLAATLCVTANVAAQTKIEQGKALVTQLNCASCHGADFNTPTDPSYPRLAGQHEDYLKHSLIAYRRGTTAMNGRNNATMSVQAKGMKDEDIAAIAAYLHSLPGTLVLRK